MDYLSNILFYISIPILCIFTLRNPFVGLCTYYFWSFYRPADIYFYSIGAEGVRFARIIAGLTILSFIIHWKKYKASLLAPIQNKLMVLLIIFLWISHFNSLNPEWSRYFSTVITKMFTMYLLLTVMASEEKYFRKILCVFIVSFILLAWWTTEKYYFEGYYRIEDALAYSGTYADRNTFAMLFVVAMPFCFYFPFTTKNLFIKAILWLFCPVMINDVAITASRGGFLGMCASGLGTVFKIKNKGLLILVLILGILTVWRFQRGYAAKRVETIFVEPEERDAAAQSRISAWKAALECIGEYPLGVGAFCFRFYRSETWGRGLSTHNFYLQIAAEQGILSGIIVVILLIISLYELRVIRKVTKYNPKLADIYTYASAIQGSFYGFMVGSMFLSLNVFEPFYFLVGLVVCLKNILYQELMKNV